MQMHAFQTTADLLTAFPAGPLADGTKASTSGRTVEGDGGGALFFYESSDTTSADNGGTIRVDAQGRRWHLEFSGPIVVNWFGVDPASADNTAALNNAIAVANDELTLLEWPVQGTYTFTTTAPLTTLGGCLGMTSQAGAILEFNTPTSCVVARGNYKVFYNIFINNSDVSARIGYTAALHVINCAYGLFTKLQANVNGDNNCGILLQHVYDGSADDAYFLTHLGCWYNSFVDPIANYVTLAAPSANTGYGAAFNVDPSAMNVVNPTGQQPGTYSGSCRHNIILNPNAEGHRSNFLFDTLCVLNQVYGGQTIGGSYAVEMIDSMSNRFSGTTFNQPAVDPVLETGASDLNLYDVSLARPGVATPWSFGTLGASSVVRYNDFNSNKLQRFSSGIGCYGVNAIGPIWYRSGSSGLIANNAAFAITLPVTYGAWTLTIVSTANQQIPSVSVLGTDGSNVGVQAVATGLCTVANNGANGVTVTNLGGVSATLFWFLRMDGLPQLLPS